MLSILPGSQLNLVSIFSDPLLDFLPHNLPLAHFGAATVFTAESFPSTSDGLLTGSVTPEDVKFHTLGGYQNALLLPRSSKICHVCETGGAAPHYGGIVCGGCKIFFARAVQKKIYYVCEKNGACKMLPGKRSKCRSCRFQRCLKARMCPEEVGKLKDLKMPETLLIPKEEGTVVAYFHPDLLKNTIGEQRLILEKQFLMEFSTVSEIKRVIKHLLQIEFTCDNNQFPSPVSEEKSSISLEIPLLQAIRNPQIVSERSPMDWAKAKLTKFDGGEDRIRTTYCRLLLHYLEFVHSIEDLYQIEKPEVQLSLVAARFCPVMILTIAYNSYKYESEGLLFDGFMATKNECTSKIAQQVIEAIHREVIESMKRLKLTEEEYILVKFIAFFTISEPSTSEAESQASCRTLRFKYERFLLFHVREENPKLEEAEVIFRIQELMQLVCSLSTLAQTVHPVLFYLISFNFANLRGELTYDLHIRRY